MPLIFGIILVQILFAVHCVRTGRPQGWLMVIIFLPILGCIAYFLVEVLPGIGRSREVQIAKAAAVRTLDPERELRAAREALDVADTATNRIALADRLADLERWDEAVAEYRAGVAKAPHPERGPATRLARALFEAGRHAEALSVLDGLPETRSDSERDRAGLLRAKVLDELGDSDTALALYRDLGERLPGGEAQCREAALLLRLDRVGEARTALEEVERRLKRIGKRERARERQMYDWAMRTLAELRTNA